MDEDAAVIDEGELPAGVEEGAVEVGPSDHGVVRLLVGMDNDLAALGMPKAARLIERVAGVVDERRACDGAVS